MPNRYYTRRFLDKRGHHFGGYILAFVEDTSKRRTESDWTDTELTLADCGREISVSFEVSPEELASSLHKVDVLIETLTRFCASLVDEGCLSAERKRRAR